MAHKEYDANGRTTISPPIHSVRKNCEEWMLAVTVPLIMLIARLFLFYNALYDNRKLMWIYDHADKNYELLIYFT